MYIFILNICTYIYLYIRILGPGDLAIPLATRPGPGPVPEPLQTAQTHEGRTRSYLPVACGPCDDAWALPGRSWSHFGVQKGAPRESKSSVKREKVASGTHAFFEHFPATMFDGLTHDFVSPKTSKIVLPCRRQRAFQEIAFVDADQTFNKKT